MGTTRNSVTDSRKRGGGRFQSMTNKGDEFRASQEVKIKDIIVNEQREEKKKRNKIINGGGMEYLAGC